MELIRGLHNLRPRHVGCVATIGNFDGVHLGHQAVLGQLVEKGQALGLPTTVIIFEPQPLEIFQPSKVPPRLTRLREKIQALKRYSVDRVLCINFNEHFAQLSAEDFIQRLLVDGLGVRYLVVGDDFQFGKGRSGNFAKLEQAGKDMGFQAVTMRTFSVDGERVSSTRVREALEQGNLEEAEKLLGRPYRMCGRVAHGDKIGRTLGIPTANIFCTANDHLYTAFLWWRYLASKTNRFGGQPVSARGQRWAERAHCWRFTCSTLTTIYMVNICR